MQASQPDTRIRRSIERQRRMVRSVLVCAISWATFSTGCWEKPYAEEGIAKLERFDSPAAMKAYLADQVERMNTRGGGDPGIFSLLFLGGAAAPMQDSVASGTEGFSTTNIQEEGVDEGDKVKTDGTYLYVLGQKKLHIVQAVPADQMTLLATLDLPGSPDSLYLVGSRVVALSRPAFYCFENSIWGDPCFGGESGHAAPTVTVVDVSDPTAPAVERSVELSGNVVTSRLIGTALHVVLVVYPSLPGDGSPNAIRNGDLDLMIPDMTDRNADGSEQRRNLADWQSFYHPVDPDGHAMSVVVTLDVADPNGEPHSVAVMAAAGTVYASQNALYLSDPDYNPVGEMRETTDIYRFDLDAGGAALAGAGTVPGRLLNRYSLGEHEGYLRAATTQGNVSRTGDATVTSGVYVLGLEGDALNVIGSVEGIAPGEQIYSARFVGPRGFLVTFKKIDPLFTLDLSDPGNPFVAGELKVPGYSDYIWATTIC